MSAPAPCLDLDGPTRLLVLAVPEDDRTVVTIAGEADLSTAPLLRDGLLASLHHGRRSVVVDAAGLLFCDLQGLDVLSGFVVIAERYGVDVTVLPSRQLARLLTLLGEGPRTSGQPDLDPSGRPLPRPRHVVRLPATVRGTVSGDGVLHLVEDAGAVGAGQGRLALG